MKPILEVRHITKQFKIGAQQERYLSLRDALANPFKKKEGQNHNTFLALDDVSFDVYPGESIGIIGRNGAGKSTLLKILSRITPPTRGKIIGRGRIASLLEVGTGFHPELTGRENIFMNGSILGMRKFEIDKHFDAIVNFSGIEKFLDTPLKRYSSGMQLRLAFAVAAFLEPEILIIDEVLAVGDAEFQKKCLGKMDEVSKSGRTVLFVSHDLSAVSTLTKKSVFLDKGKLIQFGNTPAIIQAYSSNLTQTNIHLQEVVSESPCVTKVEMITSEGGTLQGNEKPLAIHFEIQLPYDQEGMALSIQIFNHLNQPVTYNWYFDEGASLKRRKGVHQLSINFENLKLYQGNYFVRVHLAETITKTKFQQFDCCPFEIVMIDKKAPEWGWQNNVCQYIEKGEWVA
ncbi:MAG: ATP-binding cassette domain-containing protein [Bacteroidetes bacterium]|nr:ATP-binding cassette domain-containing protein [Bacteroidota bacterium]